jgi:hypothetical protein
MIKFKDYIAESKEGAGLTIWDIDETLFNTKAQIHVVKDGKLVKKLSNTEYNTYTRKPGETYDFVEFKDAKHFRDTSEPIVRAIAKAKAIHKNIKNRAGSKMIIITARSDFDDRDTFLDTFRQQGIDIDDVHVHRSGNLDAPNSAAGKKIVIKQYLETGKYARVRLFDDAISNLDMLLGLKTEYPDIDFEAYLAHHDGTMTRYRK